MQIETIVVGRLQTNCYILKKNKQILIIDPGSEFEKIKQAIDNKVIGILITHNHPDHIGALKETEEFFQTKTYNKNNLEEKEYQIGNFKFDVIYTPGHTSDSVTYYFKKENVMFTGDFIFYETIGYTHFKTGSMEEMKKSIEKIKEYPENIMIYPGHDIKTSLKHEKIYNKYFTN